MNTKNNGCIEMPENIDFVKDEVWLIFKDGRQCVCDFLEEIARNCFEDLKCECDFDERKCSFDDALVGLKKMFLDLPNNGGFDVACVLGKKAKVDGAGTRFDDIFYRIQCSFLPSRLRRKYLSM